MFSPRKLPSGAHSPRMGGGKKKMKSKYSSQSPKKNTSYDIDSSSSSSNSISSSGSFETEKPSKEVKARIKSLSPKSAKKKVCATRSGDKKELEILQPSAHDKKTIRSFGISRPKPRAVDNFDTSEHRRNIHETEKKGTVDSKGHNVYIRSDDHVWIPAHFSKSDGSKASVTVQHFENEQEILSNIPLGRARGYAKPAKYVKVSLQEYGKERLLPLQNVDGKGQLLDYQDMVNLPHLHEAGILYNLKSRHVQGIPYTRTGDILIALNPYQWFKSLYTDEKKDLYGRAIVWQRYQDVDARSYLEPHVYEVSALSYKGMCMDNLDQSILVSGESGAGKTETVKLCMDHITSVQHGPSGTRSRDDKQSKKIVNLVIDTSVLLEAFGHAKTRRNDNSSRFGKYTQLQFDTALSSASVHGRSTPAKLAGSKCEVYLLEKIRVVAHNVQERNFHIFYQILSASEFEKAKMWAGLSGATYETFRFVGPTTQTEIGGLTDGEQFKITCKGLATLGIQKGSDQFNTLMRAVVIVLQLGNVRFTKDKKDDEYSNISSENELRALSELMGISEADITEALTKRTMKTRSETYKVPLNVENAKSACNAFAKEIYGKVFLWLVAKINHAACAESNYHVGSNTSSKLNYGIIGLLDIFGFEVFPHNQFEQICINYANEKIQQKFTEDIFRTVQTEYEEEGIPLDEIYYEDNTAVIDLIEGRDGLLAVLNEECIRPKGNSETFINKAMERNRKSEAIIIDKYDKLSFGIHHFAGKVMYDAEFFVVRNKDTLPTDLMECAVKCKNNEIISTQFREDLALYGEQGTDLKTTAKSARGLGGGVRASRSNIVAPTVWTKYKSQLKDLMKDLRTTQTRYIRCIKSNHEKEPIKLDHKLVVEQLRSNGVVAGVSIARSCFPNQLDNKRVLARYKSMWEDRRNFPSRYKQNDSIERRQSEDCIAVLSCALKDKKLLDKDGKLMKSFLVGKTKTYFRSGILESLESRRLGELDGQAVTIQKVVRGWLVHMRDRDKRDKQRQEKEALLLKEQEEKAKKERERQKRQKERDVENQKLKDKIKQLQKQISLCPSEKETALQDADDRMKNVKRTLRQYAKKMVEGKYNAADQANLIAELKKRIDNNKQLVKSQKLDHKDFKKKHEKISKMYNKQNKAYDQNMEEAGDVGSKQLEVDDLQKENDDLKKKDAAIRKKKYDKMAEMERIQAAYMKAFDIRVIAKDGMMRCARLVKNKSNNRDLRVEVIQIQQESETEAIEQDKRIKANWEREKTIKV